MSQKLFTTSSSFSEDIHTGTRQDVTCASCINDFVIADSVNFGTVT